MQGCLSCAATEAAFVDRTNPPRGHEAIYRKTQTVQEKSLTQLLADMSQIGGDILDPSIDKFSGEMFLYFTPKSLN